MGLLILVSRVKAITQVVGYLVVENGIFLFGLTLLHEMPLMVELGILLDVFVGVFVMAIVVYHMRREFDHMDTHMLDRLKETGRMFNNEGRGDTETRDRENRRCRFCRFILLFFPSPSSLRRFVAPSLRRCNDKL